MAHYFETVVDITGKPKATGVTCTVYLVGTSTLASLFSDSGLSVAKSNPFSLNASGEIDFYVTSGLYKIVLQGSTIQTKTVDNIQIGTASGSSGVIKETPSGALNGSNKAFVLTYTPATGSVKVFLNGILLEDGSDVSDPFPAGYVLSGKTITLTDSMVAPNSADGDWIEVEYVA